MGNTSRPPTGDALQVVPEVAEVQEYCFIENEMETQEVEMAVQEGWGSG